LKHHKADKDTDIVNNVLKLQLETGFRVGILKTQALLAKKGITVGHNRLARIMNENSLNPKFNRKRYPPEYYEQRKSSKKSQERVNVLNRQFEAQRPREKLVTDMTYIRVTEGWLYLSTVIDLFNSDVVAFLMSKQLNVDFAINTLDALSNSGQVHQTACIFHSDQGFTYTHERFVEALKTKGFTQSFSRVGNCWDNACAESFFGHLKAELGITHQKKVLSYTEMERKIKDYIEYYRTKRVQARLAYRTPHEAMLDYQAALS
jgi:transposase InsO family protein